MVIIEGIYLECSGSVSRISLWGMSPGPVFEELPCLEFWVSSLVLRWRICAKWSFSLVLCQMYN